MGYKILVSILGLFGLFGFCIGQTTGTKNNIKSESTRGILQVMLYNGYDETFTSEDEIQYFNPYQNNESKFMVVCVQNNSSNRLHMWFGPSDLYINANSYKECFVMEPGFPDFRIFNNGSTNYNITAYDGYKLSQCPASTQQECEETYSLMPISSCDSEYCELNNLCEVIGGSGSSTLYINDVWHESAPFIYLNIPEEFKWDYSTGEQEFTVNVVGYNTDSDYISGIINTQKSKPTNDDLQNIFFGLVPLLFPGLVFFLFLYFAFKFIKKIF